MLEAGDEVLGGHGVVLLAAVGGPDRVVADGEGPFGGVLIGGPLGGHAGDQLAVGILGQQALDEVGDVVAVGGLVVVNIVQGGDIEVVDHGIGVRAVGKGGDGRQAEQHDEGQDQCQRADTCLAHGSCFLL